jgi:hypothetical protein
MSIERLTIIVEGKSEEGNRIGTIILNNEPVSDCDLEWLPNYPCDVTGISTTVHAVQWYGGMGEIELTTRGSNIEITELGVLETALEKFEQRKQEIEEENLAEQQRLSEINTVDDDSYFDQLLNELLVDLENPSEEETITE